MLHRLNIRNYALIDELELQLEEGMNTITGETGAGKSILLGALSLILGQRADNTALSDKSQKCIVEGEFRLPRKGGLVRQFLSEHELDDGSSVIIRREISAEGKSRAFVNDTPVNLQQLRELGELLVDVHSQHETLLLNKRDFQRSVVDVFAGMQAEMQAYREKYKTWSLATEELARLIEEEERTLSEKDFLGFQFRELEEAALKAGEQPALEAELRALTHAGEISQTLDAAATTLESGEDALIGPLNNLIQGLNSVSKYDVRIQELAQRIKSSLIELKDIASEAGNLSAHFQSDPARLEQIQERLDILYRLQHKHRKQTEDELISLQDELRLKLDSIGSMEERIAALKVSTKQQQENLMRQAEAVSEKRRSAIPTIEKKISSLLAEVSMPHAKLKIDAGERLVEPGPYGIDQIRFTFSANKGGAFADLNKVASGGELSRLMLCLKSAVAGEMELPTMIFDEIDTGVSGETAYRIGHVMRNLSRKHQLICITHLPQIASRGDAHWYVHKEVSGKKTNTRVRRLEADDRVVEIARMLSGEKPGANALANARELLNQ
ncbi:MAG: DNA repair protein RecN [Bacteroidia bacterium]|nr:DNA repair protein RecN [Bacteroidia bacterium]MBP7270889.1 DNA repair protein RecN [Bacteroidia bacterium]MBP7437519.1 DNA repair protein RecN [Bacteroidia bacterium]